MVGRRCGNDRFGLADAPVSLLEALQEAGQGAGAHGDVTADLDISLAQLARHYAVTFFGGWVFDPEKILGEQLAEAPMNFADSLSTYGAAAS